MGTGEESTTPKPSKPASSSQEVPTTPSYHDWPSPVQAYYGAGAAPPFFASTVTSPTPHPYIWGGQHHLIPPYGTPVPYPAIYPPGAVYAHPNMATTVVPTQAAAELEGKGADVKDGLSAKKSKGNLGNSVAKTGDGIKATSGSGNDGASQSGESGSEGSSDGSEDHNQQDYASNKKGSFDQMLVDGANAQNNSAGGNIPVSVTGKPIGTAPATTNLNIGMDLWNPSTAAGATKMRPNPAGAAGTIVPAGMMTDQWIQDERELKRQRRKQSNRESARRSRLRKQAECEELQVRVENLSNENRTLRDELQRLSEECEKLTSENSSIKEELTRLCGPEALANLEQDSNSNSVTVSHQNEGDS